MFLNFITFRFFFYFLSIRKIKHFSSSLLYYKQVEEKRGEKKNIDTNTDQDYDDLNYCVLPYMELY